MLKSLDEKSGKLPFLKAFSAFISLKTDVYYDKMY